MFLVNYINMALMLTFNKELIIIDTKENGVLCAFYDLFCVVTRTLISDKVPEK